MMDSNELKSWLIDNVSRKDFSQGQFTLPEEAVDHGWRIDLYNGEFTVVSDDLCEAMYADDVYPECLSNVIPFLERVANYSESDNFRREALELLNQIRGRE